jgi:homoserine dehydrogenase
VKVGIIGYGTVGKATAKVLVENVGVFSKRASTEVALKRVAALEFSSEDEKYLQENGVLFSHDAEDVLQDEEIAIVVELVGGIEPAKSFITSAINNRKNVVTANKALLATLDGQELFRLAYESRTSLRYEAAVCGAIPIVNLLQDSFFGDKILSVHGILNGTTNFILGEMENGFTQEEAIKSAQEKGYAELDASYDIEGKDSAAKITLLANMIFGAGAGSRTRITNKYFTVDDVNITGIQDITSSDVIDASKEGKIYKLLARATPNFEEGTVELTVAPEKVDAVGVLSETNGVFNIITLKLEGAGDIAIFGLGAGGEPTASAVVADIVRAAKARKQSQMRKISIRNARNGIRQQPRTRRPESDTQ